MTSKEAYLKIVDFINDIQLGIERSSLDIVEPLNVIKKLTKQQSNSTLSECIKEWEDRGFVYENNDKRIYFANEKENILIYIQKELKDVTISVYHYNYAQTISFDLYNLIHKTLKALEVEK